MIETMECEACEGSGRIVEAGRTSGVNQHSACQRGCDECDGVGRVIYEEASIPVEFQAAHDALDRMKSAYERGTGCQLTADMVRSLAITFIGQIWADERPLT